MRKYRRNNKRFIVVIAIIAVVTVIILLATIILPNAAKEKEYQKGLEAVQTKDYATAESIFRGLAEEDYKDSFFVNTLTQYRIELESVKEAAAVAMTTSNYDGYDTVIADIDKYSEIFNNVGDADNDIIIADISSAQNEVIQLKNDIEVKRQREQEEQERIRQENEQFLQTAVETANTDGYLSAYIEIGYKYSLNIIEYLSALPDSEEGHARGVRSTTGAVDEDVKTLYLYYIHKNAMEEIDDAKRVAQEQGKDYEAYKESVRKINGLSPYSTYQSLMNSEAERDVIAGISPDYSGFLSDEIVKYCLDYFGSKEEWQNKHDAYIEQEAKLLDAFVVQKKKPEIGMTELEVIQTTWGAPEKKNTTTTSGGTSEQWVYSNNRYVYLDNGIVTAIQE